MRTSGHLRYLAILLVLSITALSVGGVLGETLALPLILLSLSLLFFTLAREHVTSQDVKKAKRYLTIGLFLFVLFIIMSVYAFSR